MVSKFFENVIISETHKRLLLYLSDYLPPTSPKIYYQEIRGFKDKRIV